MPDEGPPKKANGDAPVVSVPAPIQAVPVPPPPETQSPIQFNQQVNVYQIPQNAWDRLTPAQTMELTKMILDQAESTDKRHFEFALAQANSEDRGKKLCIWIGGFVALAGFAGASYLGIHGHEIAALSISLPLVTILAMIVGNRFLDN
jgi:hypothetical protein